MKLLLAIIQPTKLKSVQESLARIGVERMTVYDTQGYARQRGQTAMYRGVEYKSKMLRKVALEIAVNDDFLEKTIDTINQVARTGPEGEIGDGKIFVLPMEDTWQLGGRERGPEAI
jgi:nitrogen regulatory protein PII